MKKFCKDLKEHARIKRTIKKEIIVTTRVNTEVLLIIFVI